MLDLGTTGLFTMEDPNPFPLARLRRLRNHFVPLLSQAWYLEEILYRKGSCAALHPVLPALRGAHPTHPDLAVHRPELDCFGKVRYETLLVLLDFQVDHG